MPASMPTVGLAGQLASLPLQLKRRLLIAGACYSLQSVPAALASASSSRHHSSSSSSSISASTALPEDVASAEEGPAALYTAGIQSGTYRPDPLQVVTVQKLQRLFTDLRAAHPAPVRRSGLTMVDAVGATNAHTSWFDSIGNLLRSNAGLHASAGPMGQRSSVKGLYMFGGVGCGKTMLMDLLVASAPREFQVERTHFHDFMLDIHGRLSHTKGESDPLKHVADDVAAGSKVLALDELFVNDVADAMILHRLFGRLWDNGLVLVATSNRAPDALYEGGLQRQLFLPFIARLKEACVIHDMKSPADYRRLAHHTRGIYFLTPDRTFLLHKAFLACGEDSLVAAGNAAAGGSVGNPGAVNVEVAMGRSLHVPQAIGSAAMFDFDELCNRPLAAADYIALAEKFHTLAVADVPRFNAANRSAGYRFVTLIDVMYEHRVRMLLSADGTPFELFERVVTQQEARQSAHSSRSSSSTSSSSSHHSQSSMRMHGYSSSSSSNQNEDIVVDDQLAFAKDRTISRLTEMQSIEYLLAHAKQHAPHMVLALQEMHQKQQQT